MTRLSYLLCLCIAFLLFHVSIYAEDPSKTTDTSPKDYVEERLVEKGLDRTRVHMLLNDPRVSLDEGIIIKNLFFSKPKGTQEKPEQMVINPLYIVKGKEFIINNAKTLLPLKDRFETSPEIITAILIVESKLGTYPEKYNVFLAYTNLIAILDPRYFSRVQETYKEKYPELKDEKTILRAQKRGTWAINQLYNLIVLADEIQMDPLNIIGSFSGAIGPGQFVPSSFREFGVDGNNDSRRDPFNMADSMASIANYLMLHGWQEDASIEKKRSAIWAYNHSDVYVNTIMMLYNELSSIQ